MRRLLLIGCAVAACACSRTRLPSVDSPVYDNTTRTFYHGLAELQVGLLDDAKSDFTKATALVPEEPASWANLGLTSLRLGEFDVAAGPIDKAVSLAPGNSEVRYLHGRLQTSRGRLDEGIADYRRAADLDPNNMRVRYALAEEIERAGGPNADRDAQQLFEAILKARPGNLAVTLERARLAAKRSDSAALDDCLRLLDAQAAGWPEAAAEQFRGLKSAVASKNYPEAARSVAFLRNVLVRVPAFRESLAAVRTPTELIADPFETFIALPAPSSNPSPADDGLTFTRESAPASPLPRGAVAVDWNRDFKMDYAVAGKDGVRIFTQQDNGSYKDATPRTSPLTVDTAGVWTADIEMDGDVDLIAGVRAAAPVVLRNNGDGTWRQMKPFAGVAGVRAFAWGDVDGDGDPDAVLVGDRGDLHVFENRQAGEFREMPAPPSSGAVLAVALGDVNADGRLDIVSLDTNGVVRRTAWAGGRWNSEPIGQWPSEIPADAVGAYRIFVEDVDNNGALDVVVSGGGKAQTHVYLAGGPDRAIDIDTLAVVDTNGDGMLDLLGDGVRYIGKGTKGYHWQVMRPRAQPVAGDQRINSFGVGGEIEIRSGRLTEKQIIGSQPVHFGLGTRTAIDVARIFWPNGIMQADFDRKADQEIVAEQRLKGSCPWVFTWDGTSMRFVTDFLWRSPLGLRINAVDTAGVTQTEDWVKIRGDQLVARDGKYDVRITAELWETHFVDHVSLLVVDHPADTEVYVDERFAREAPALAVHTLTHPRPVAHAWDDGGRDVTEIVSKQDGRYLSTFARGEYQGIAKDHFVEVDLGRRGRGRWLVANGWIYPTDSSINVAIGQQNIQPHGIALEAQDERGQWKVVAPDLGFPAGKNKTILIDLSRIGAARRIRLRTNLEIYWDSLALADDASGAEVKPVTLTPVSAELRYRGFSKTDYSHRDVPETPDYDHLANIDQRWRDLVGYYTRFGDVRELLAKVDDRYVIMNAGDELRLKFAATPTSGAASRDFVLVGDGWVKDGDYNTTASATVGPLPRHGHAEYAVSKSDSIEDDPVFKAHPQDWQQFHTRFVDPRDFLRGLH